MISRPWLQIPYRAAQKVAVFEGVRTLVATTEQLSHQPEREGVMLLTPATLKQQREQGNIPSCEPYVDRLCEQGLHCYGAMQSGALVGFAWVWEGSIEAGMNRGYHPGTATAIHLEPTAAFVFHVYTSPRFRGSGWMRSLLGQAARDLRSSSGVEWFVTTTEVINRSAWTGLSRIGFEQQGIYWRYGFGRHSWGSYPEPSLPILAYG